MAPLSSLLSEKFSEQGTFGSGMAFLQWLKDTKQSAWQLLPLQQTPLEPGSDHKHIPSPYKSYGIGLDPRYLSKTLECPTPTSQQLDKFMQEEKYWIPDYILFCALRDHFSTDDWGVWPMNIRKHEKKEIDHYQEKLKTIIAKHLEMQWQLHFQYKLLRQKSETNNILLIGDLPFYVGYKSPLVWGSQELFNLTAESKMKKVSGTLDGPHASFGRQIWNHPLYRWNTMEEKLMIFWKMRLKYLSGLFDCVRIDYAKGFFCYGVINLEDDKKDVNSTGPGESFFKQLITYMNEKKTKIFVEDLGQHTEKLLSTIQKYKIPGTRIFRFSINLKRGKKINFQNSDFLSYPQNVFAYTTTHDTETLLEYLELLTAFQKETLAHHAGIVFSSDDYELAKALRQAIINSPAHYVLIPIQDWLLTKDRINIPGTEKEVGDENWQYKLKTPVEKLPTVF